jgi:hypothetical protein
MAKAPVTKSGAKPVSEGTAATGRRRTSKAAASTLPPDAATKHRVRIRMYRQGIGDSFLLTFYTGQTPAHILIDCGVLVGTKDGKAWTQRIADDVAQASGGHVHAVVGTHPHWDHLSGFYDAREKFQALKVDEVWLAWTENPQDPEGREKTRRRELLLEGARTALARLAASPDAAMRARASAIDAILAFHGPADVLAASGARGTSAALDALRALVPQPRYYEPGDLFTPDWLSGVRIYVLGPPHDEAYLGKVLGKKGSEMYGLGGQVGLIAALARRSAAGTPNASTDEEFEATCPFDTRLCWSGDEAGTSDLLKPVLDRYSNPDADWRTIDDEWLLSAEQLALQLDNVVNNLSLVLAFELVETEQVLLFSADAQIGNWLSWQKLEWKGSGAAVGLTVNDLLARTAFYKVGHHGSHNGTLMQEGLEAMSSPDLVAAIPVDQHFANTVKDWDMPQNALYRALLDKTGSRVLRSDGAGPTATDATLEHSDARAWAVFSQRVAVDPGQPSLYVDCFLP